MYDAAETSEHIQTAPRRCSRVTSSKVARAAATLRRTRFLSWDCRALARHWSSRSFPAIRRLRGPRNCPRSSPSLAALARESEWTSRRRIRTSWPRWARKSLGKLGEEYLERTRIQRRLGRPFFVDKMPNNFAHVGLIQLILPNAKIVDVRRHPLGCSFSCFKQHFARGRASRTALMRWAVTTTTMSS